MTHARHPRELRAEDLRAFSLIPAVDREEGPGDPALFHPGQVDVAVAWVVTVGELPAISLQMSGCIDVRVDDDRLALHACSLRANRLGAARAGLRLSGMRSGDGGGGYDDGQCDRHG